jgi:carbamate kinase
MKTMLLAVGGNSLIRAGEKGTITEQRANAQRTAVQIVGLIRAGYRLVLTHGNGPQVGAQLLRSERAASQVPGHPLDVCGASTQGEIGYLLEQSLQTELQQAGLHVPVTTILTQSLVSPDDPSPQQTHRSFLFARRCRGAPAPLWMGDRRRCSARLSPCGAFSGSD